MDDLGCFGFYSGEQICQTCAVRRRCKSLLVSVGFDALGDSVDELIANLEDLGIQRVPDVDTPRDMIAVLIGERVATVVRGPATGPIQAKVDPKSGIPIATL